MPIQPKEEEIEQDLGSIHLRFANYIITTNQITFGVSFTDYPPEIVATNTADVMLDRGMRKIVASGHHAQVESSKTVFRGFPARSFSVEDPVTRYSQVGKYFLVGSRLYVIQVVHPSRIVANRETDRFMESFRIEKK